MIKKYFHITGLVLFGIAFPKLFLDSGGLSALFGITKQIIGI